MIQRWRRGKNAVDSSLFEFEPEGGAEKWGGG